MKFPLLHYLTFNFFTRISLQSLIIGPNSQFSFSNLNCDSLRRILYGWNPSEGCVSSIEWVRRFIQSTDNRNAMFIDRLISEYFNETNFGMNILMEASDLMFQEALQSQFSLTIPIIRSLGLLDDITIEYLSSTGFLRHFSNLPEVLSAFQPTPNSPDPLPKKVLNEMEFGKLSTRLKNPLRIAKKVFGYGLTVKQITQVSDIIDEFYEDFDIDIIQFLIKYGIKDVLKGHNIIKSLNLQPLMVALFECSNSVLRKLISLEYLTHLGTFKRFSESVSLIPRYQSSFHREVHLTFMLFFPEYHLKIAHLHLDNREGALKLWELFDLEAWMMDLAREFDWARIYQNIFLEWRAFDSLIMMGLQGGRDLFILFIAQFRSFEINYPIMEPFMSKVSLEFARLGI